MQNSDHIVWITPDYFLNVDAKVVTDLANYYPIDWILIQTHNSERAVEGLLPGSLTPRRYILQYRQRDPRIISQYVSLLSSIRRKGYSLLYNSFDGLPFFFPTLSMMIDPDRVIYGVHDVHTPKGASKEWFMRLYQRYAYTVVKRFHVFSKYQLRVIQELLPHKTHYFVPFGPDDYGGSTAIPPSDRIRFTSFGYIRRYKRLDLLISAFKVLYEEGFRNIELLIAGKCDDWGQYEAMIDNHPAIYSRIGVVPNREVPDLISSSHYLVLPYQDGTQSGVLPLAYRYHRPVITSDIEAFQDAVIEGTTGYQFRSLSLDSLCQVMRNVINTHNTQYQKLTQNVKQYVETEYSQQNIVDRYRLFIDDTLNALHGSPVSLSKSPRESEQSKASGIVR